MRKDQDEVLTDDLDADGWSLKERGGDGDSGFSREGVWFARGELEENETYLVRLWGCSKYQRPINLSWPSNNSKKTKNSRRNHDEQIMLVHRQPHVDDAAIYVDCPPDVLLLR
jgi:hypothetical protein